MAQTHSLQWDIFCRVIDNHGDLGVCLRLARHLDARGERVRLWVDDARALAWMAASARERDWALPWPEDLWAPPTPHQVVLETFGCHLPLCVEQVLAAAPPCAWLNLEYLSAEAWVEGAHGLPSPVMTGPAQGLRKRFCYPGFGERTGGLLTERPEGEWDTHSTQASPSLPAFDPSRRHVSLFCYPHAPMEALLRRLARQPTCVWVAGGNHVQAAAHAAWRALDPASQRLVALKPLPWLDQPGYDALLRRCDLNVVRGEDSFVRAQWAGKPWLWHIYPQGDGSDALKLHAFLDRWLRDQPADLVDRWRRTWLAWNGLAPPSDLALNHDDGLDRDGQSHANAWRNRLWQWPDLASTLMAWARENP